MALSFTATTTHTKTLVNPSTGGDDKVYGADYVSASSHTTAISAYSGFLEVAKGGTGLTGLTANQLLYASATDTLAQSANLTYSETSGPRLAIGTGSGTSAGFIIGYSNAFSGYSCIWSSAVTPSISNYALLCDVGGNTTIGGVNTVNINPGNVTKIAQTSTAGAGPTFTMGTAASDVGLRATQTWNASGVSFKAKRLVVTPTAAAAGSLLESWEYNTGQGTGVAMLTELTTIAAAATTDTTIQIPANAIVLGVSVRVTTVIPTAATFTVTGTTSGTAFQTGATVSTAANTTDAGTKNCPYLNATAQTVRITPNVNPADNSGRVRVTIHYIVITPPTS